jgi:small-conductance mechanosensitive channel
MGKTFETMAQEAEWCDLILEAPDILAVEGLAASGVTLKIRAKTAPMQQWNVSREYRRRLKQQFEQAGIAMGRPQQTITIEPGSANSLLPTSEFTNKPDPE